MDLKNDNFRVTSLKVNENPFFGDNTFNFVDDKDNQDSIYTTVIIGPNGTGKSNLFRFIIELFRELWTLKVADKRTYNVKGKFRLEYYYFGDKYIYSNYRFDDGSNKYIQEDLKKTSIYLLKNDELVSFSEAGFPASIIANSIMLTDKYLVTRNKLEQGAFSPYKYLGVRNRPQQASTRSYIRKTVEFIVQNIDGMLFLDGLKKTTDFLNLGSSVQVIYQTRYTKSYYTGNIKPKDLENYFDEIDEKYKDSNKIPPFKLNYFKRLKKDFGLNGVCNFMNELVKQNSLEHIYRSSNKKIIYDIIQNDTNKKEIASDFSNLEHLRNLGFLTPPEIKLDNGNFHLQESSSGEYHFFSSMVGLLATVKPYSLIFIDEPEISLHPNWQIKYLEFLREVFSHSAYASCHFMIATHSHFLISDLKGKSSKILGLSKQQRKLNIFEFSENLNTYGWSAEDVLFRIFNLKTSRNHYFEMAVADLIDLLYSKSRDTKKINNILKNLKRLDTSDSDPLNELIVEAEEYLNDNTNS
ncbi:AAA family ATPase [Jejuia spongiicola]|uniref:ATP-binding protein n=1 Tax=Jejuia spongiicola TaxID=2942207 RepID=A0ABT0QD48_9FLAO|nr:AAA family ATPase [Jejuia spongiicola]MCL6294912.1 ATP-binding protein [Jejuia spongiicola]